MAFCRECGTQLADGAKFCPSCGTAVTPVSEGITLEKPVVETEQTSSPVQQSATTQSTGSHSSGTQSSQQGTPLTEEQDITQNKTMAVLSYILFFVPLLVGTHKTSPYVKFHVNQGTVLFIFAVAWGLILSIIMGVIGFVFGIIGLRFITRLFGVLTWVLRYVPLALVIYGCLNALNGVKKELPIIGKLTIIK